MRAVKEMGKQGEIDKSEFYVGQVPGLVDWHGGPVETCGVVTLTFKLGIRLYHATFCVFPSGESDHIDVILGAQFLAKERLVTVNDSVMLILTEQEQKLKVSHHVRLPSHKQ
jgi:hypothetical protein